MPAGGSAGGCRGRRGRRLLEDLKPFVFGGVAACAAEATTFPIDTAKTRLQLQGEAIERMATAGRTAGHYHPRVPYSGLMNVWIRVAAEEGPPALYRGLSPALLRQASYGTIKFGLYYTVKEALPGPETPAKNVACAVLAGAVSAAVANPTDVLKVRLQARRDLEELSEESRKGLTRAFGEIFSTEGVRGLFRGVVPTAQRAAVVAGVQLPVYDLAKTTFLSHGVLPDGATNHLLSSFLAGLCACASSCPIDVVRTRLMSQRKLLSSSPGSPGGPQVYASSLQCAMSTVRSEGAGALYKGFVPSFMRMGPWNVIFFLVYEQLKKQFPPASSAQD